MILVAKIITYPKVSDTLQDTTIFSKQTTNKIVNKPLLEYRFIDKKEEVYIISSCQK